MLKNLKRAASIALSFAMAIQFGMADTYYANTVSQEPEVEEQTIQEPATAACQRHHLSLRERHYWASRMWSCLRN